ncbi:MAG: AarF/UbiB family protein [Anaerolineales bacterium]|nr:AarF/UbiB family protein [Anaerolineales bacterium]
MLRSRYRRIVFFFARAILNIIYWDLVLPRLGLRGWSRRTRQQRLHRIAAGFRRLAIQMGGVLIKVGQFLSARVDVLPEEITTELAGLQDEVPAEDFADIRRVAEAELGAPFSEGFASFDATPLAAASLGQVHRAQLHPDDIGEGQKADVVVKIQRPNIETIIATDLAALRTIGGWLQRYRPIRQRADVPAVLNEFSRTLYDEIDYLAEGRNAETFAANFRNRPEVSIPYVVWSHTTRRVLTLEDVFAIKITDYAAITTAGIDRVLVARRLFDIYLQQIFEDNFFHADPHPGNLFITPLSGNDDDGQRWRLTFVDFGMVGHIPPNLRTGLRELIIGVGSKDSDRLVNSYQMLGVLLPHADIAKLKQAEAMAFDRFWGKTIDELRQTTFEEMHEFAKEFRDLVYDMPFQIPQNLIFLGRAVAILSGMCVGLDPHFNLWERLAPFTQKLIAEETGSRNLEFWLGELVSLVQAMLVVPKRMEAVFSKIEKGEVAVRIPRIEGQFDRLEGAMRQMVGGVIFIALLLGGVQLYLAGEKPFGEVLLAGSTLALIWILLAGRRRLR